MKQVGPTKQQTYLFVFRFEPMLPTTVGTALHTARLRTLAVAPFDSDVGGLLALFFTRAELEKGWCSHRCWAHPGPNTKTRFLLRHRRHHPSRAMNQQIVDTSEERMKEVVGTLYTMAPEVLNGGITYDKSCDMWSIGVMAFMLLSGDMPFDFTTKQNLVRSVEEGKYEFSGRRWNRVSGEARRAVCVLASIVGVWWRRCRCFLSCFSSLDQLTNKFGIAASSLRFGMLRPFETVLCPLWQCFRIENFPCTPSRPCGSAGKDGVNPQLDEGSRQAGVRAYGDKPVSTSYNIAGVAEAARSNSAHALAHISTILSEVLICCTSLLCGRLLAAPQNA